jgi:hypothetical protein
MVLGVNDFKAKLRGGGARPNLFKVTLNFPTYANADVELASFMCKAAQLPASIVEPTTIAFRGRQLQYPGERTFEPWVVSIINDTDFGVRDPLERWSNGINAHSSNVGLTNPADYEADLTVEQLDRNGDVLKTYKIVGAFPTNIGSIEVSYDANGQIEEFQTEFQVQYWESNTTS